MLTSESARHRSMGSHQCFPQQVSYRGRPRRRLRPPWGAGGAGCWGHPELGSKGTVSISWKLSSASIVLHTLSDCLPLKIWGAKKSGPALLLAPERATLTQCRTLVCIELTTLSVSAKLLRSSQDFMGRLSAFQAIAHLFIAMLAAQTMLP